VNKGKEGKKIKIKRKVPKDKKKWKGINNNN